MSRAYARTSRRGRENEANTPVSGPRLKPLESSADALPTIRNFVPWREMEKKLAVRLAARAARGELTGEIPAAQPAPQSEKLREDEQKSGIRPSFFDHDVDDLTYSVYSLAELDARQDRAPKSAPVEVGPPPDPWVELRAGRWPQTWPPIKMVLSAVGIAIAIFGVCAAVALVVADLADDLKPRRSLASQAAAAPKVAPVAIAPIAPAAIAPAVAESDITLELDDVAPQRVVRPNVPKRLPAKKKGR